MIQVALSKRIIGRPGEPDVFLEKVIEMGFLPTSGMLIFDASMEHIVTEVEYDHKEGRVYAWTFPDDTLVREGPDSQCTPQIRAEIWVEDGYKVVEDDE